MQRVQNAAARIATGSVKLSAESHLHAETRMLPVQDHLSLLSIQLLASSLQPEHPSYPTVTSNPGPRDMKKKRSSTGLAIKSCASSSTEQFKMLRRSGSCCTLSLWTPQSGPGPLTGSSTSSPLTSPRKKPFFLASTAPLFHSSVLAIVLHSTPTDTG